LPAYNEEENIRPTVERALEILPRFADDLEIIVVDDGSHDRTRAIAEELAARHPQVRVISHVRNAGIAAAMRTGFDSCTRAFVFYTDGDLQFDLADIARLIALIDDADAVIGYRIKRRDPMRRIVIAGVYNRLIRLLFNVEWRDVDCAFKLFRREIFDRVPVSVVRSNGAVFFVELLLALRAGGARMREVGVPHYPRRAGRPKGALPHVILRAVWDLLALRIRLGQHARR
jgi:glycosyltransferase involved in cell wall biosynthesis